MGGTIVVLNEDVLLHCRLAPLHVPPGWLACILAGNDMDLRTHGRPDHGLEDDNQSVGHVAGMVVVGCWNGICLLA